MSNPKHPDLTIKIDYPDLNPYDALAVVLEAMRVTGFDESEVSALEDEATSAPDETAIIEVLHKYVNISLKQTQH